MISCSDWRGVTGGCAPKPEGEPIYSIQSVTPAIQSCAPSSAVIRKHPTTSSLIYGQIWTAIFQSRWTLWMFPYMCARHTNCSNLQAWFNKNAIIFPLWFCDSSSITFKWHWCCSSGHYVLFMCLFLFGNYMVCLFLWSFWNLMSLSGSYLIREWLTSQ